MRLFAPVLAAAFLLPSLLGAQIVRGEVVSHRDGRGLDVAVVQLVSASGQVVSRTLTSDRGQFILAASAPGVFRLRAQRIGFSPALTDTFSLAASATVNRRLALEPLIIALEAVTVEARNTCREYADAGAVAQLWDQARAAFNVTRLTAEDRMPAVSALTYFRDLHPRSRAITNERIYAQQGFTAQPFVSQPAEMLSARGYVVPSADGGTVYYAPDLDVLASDLFLSDHCLLRGERAGAEVSILFEPTPDRAGIADIAGAVWLRWPSLDLSRIEFEYVNVPRINHDANAGGALFFLHVGRLWAISGWEIRMPLAERSADFGRVAREHLAGIRTAGGQLVQIRQGSDTLWSLAPLRLTGRVRDSVTNTPVRDAHVTVQGTAHATTTDGEGRFTLSMLPGVYRLAIASPEMQQIGAQHDVSVPLARDKSDLEVKLPSLDYSLARICPGLQSRHGVVTGTLDADSASRRGMRVRASWNVLAIQQVDDGVSSSSSTRVVDATTDALGRFRICGVPLGTDVRISAEGAHREELVSLDGSRRFHYLVLK